MIIRTSRPAGKCRFAVPSTRPLRPAQRGRLNLELLRPSQYGEVEAFVSHHPSGCFMQSPAWAKVKPNWKHEIVVSRAQDGRLRGSMSILIMPMAPAR